MTALGKTLLAVLIGTLVGDATGSGGLTLTFPVDRLERPCMDHMQYLLVRSHNGDNQPFHHPMEAPDDGEHEHMSGHALMATAPPQSHIMGKPAEKYPHQMPADVGPEGLSKLLDLSNRLPFEHYSEITPVMAWTIIYQHAQVGEFCAQDFEQMKQELGTKVRCYGYVPIS